MDADRERPAGVHLHAGGLTKRAARLTGETMTSAVTDVEPAI
jgi:hypothetical protein